MSYIVASSLKEFCRSKDMMCAADLAAALGEHVLGVLTKAAERAQANDRKTIRPCDL